MIWNKKGARHSEIIEIPIFPLPNVVFFPNTLLPLHIFEDRYRKMVLESLEGERKIGMVLLKPGWESDLQRTPDVHMIGGMGIISDYRQLEDGKYDIMLSGISRFEILEFVSDSPYRIARVGLIREIYEEQPEDEKLLHLLLSKFRELTADTERETTELPFVKEEGFATVINALCASLPIAPLDKQALLEMDSVHERAEEVLQILSVLLDQKHLISKFEHLRPSDPSFN